MKNLIFSILVILVSIASCLPEPSHHSGQTPTSPTEVTTDDEDLKFKAFYIGKQMVEQVLKAPSSAEFPLFVDDMVSLSGNNYIVKAYVDSQNSYGAIVRSDYTISLEYKDGEWNLLSFIFDGKQVK